jgi:hypothetical protein
MLIFSVRLWPKAVYVAIGFLGLAFLSLIFQMAFFAKAKRNVAIPIKAVSIVSKDGEAMSYIVTYILPFLEVDLGNVNDSLALVLVFFVIAILYVSSNLIHTNPVLNLSGYHIFEIEDESGKASTLISKRSYFSPNSSLNVVTLGDYVVLEK